MEGKIVKAVETIQAGGSKDIWVEPYKPDSKKTADNQFIFFFKPEVTSKDAKFSEVVKMVLGKLEEAKVKVGAIRVLSGDWLKEKGTMGEHYGVISKLSREGESAMTAAAKAKLKELYATELAAGAKVLGAHQLMEKYPFLNATALRVLNDNLGTKRLAGGTYAEKLVVLGETNIVINPFHPYQLVPYIKSGNCIVVLEGTSQTAWADLRGKVCGATNPAKAEAGSIRENFLTNREKFGFSYMPSSSDNGCHMSAGPLEAMVELKRFFEVADKDTAFGGLLASKGVAVADIAKIAQNPDMTFEGDKIDNAFDATEEQNAEEAATALSKAKL